MDRTFQQGKAWGLKTFPDSSFREDMGPDLLLRRDKRNALGSRWVWNLLEDRSWTLDMECSHQSTDNMNRGGMVKGRPYFLPDGRG
jgi:hypothetical protein